MFRPEGARVKKNPALFGNRLWIGSILELTQAAFAIYDEALGSSI